MKSIEEILKNVERNSKAQSERAELVGQFLDELVRERKLDNWRRYKATNRALLRKEKIALTPDEFKKHREFLKPLSARGIAVKLAHVPTGDLYHFLSVCHDYKNRNGSFGKMFWGGLKTR